MYNTTTRDCNNILSSFKKNLPPEYQEKWYQFVNNLIQNALTTRQREVIVLYYYEKMKLPDIAQRLGITVSTVSRTKKRACQRLMQHLQYYYDRMEIIYEDSYK
ncbi:MAG: sigma-70 family RNA polymerase sigma factor [Ruminococcus sp.]|nr:sigma-70 family RNA polymerase sigma factor [Ruminococcus sp.]